MTIEKPNKQKVAKIDKDVADQILALGYKSPNAALKALLGNAPKPKGKSTLMLETLQIEKLTRLLNTFDEANFKKFERQALDAQLNYEKIFGAFGEQHKQVLTLWGKVQAQTEAINRLIDINNDLNRLLLKANTK